MLRPPAALALFCLLPGLPALGGCGKPTEIVLRLTTSGAAPSSVRVKLHRSAPFSDNPAHLPAYVTSALDGADLDLSVVPQGMTTLLSLLPNASEPSDLVITVSAAGADVSPAAPQIVGFVDGKSQELDFTITAITPDMAVPAAPDMTPVHDLAMPEDGAPKG